MGIQGRIAGKLIVATALVASPLFVKASEPEAVPGEYLVKLKEDYSVQQMNKKSLSTFLGSQVKSTIDEMNVAVIKRSAVELSSSVIKSLAENDMVEYVEPNFIYRINKTPNDPDLGKLWGIKNVGQVDKGVGTPGIDVDAERAWDITQGSDSVLVAVIDTGVNYNHPDLKENAWVNLAEKNGQAGVDDDGNGYVDDVYGYDFTETAGDPDPIDDHGHGSHCAGTIGATGNDGKGIVGVAWKVKLMGVKFLSAQGSGTLEGAVRSVIYATKMGAKIMSNSWGGGGFSQTLEDAIKGANAAGSLFVAAAGNDGVNNDSSPHYPSNYDVPNVLSVAAINNVGGMASFSNFGKRTVHLAAPGVNIHSSTLGNGYANWSGTSMATPHVSGVAVLLAANEANLTNVELKQRLVSTVKPLASVRGKTVSGGMVNAYNALTNTQAPPDPNDPTNWASKSVSISTAHPYSKNTSETFDLKVDGAKEIALYFSKFDTERGYDKVTLFDAKGAKVAEISGSSDDSYSAVIQGSSVKVVFTSDDSVEKYGFDITKIAYR